VLSTVDMRDIEDALTRGVRNLACWINYFQKYNISGYRITLILFYFEFILIHSTHIRRARRQSIQTSPNKFLLIITCSKISLLKIAFSFPISRNVLRGKSRNSRFRNKFPFTKRCQMDNKQTVREKNLRRFREEDRAVRETRQNAAYK